MMMPVAVGGIVNGRGHNYLGRMLMRVRSQMAGTTLEDADLDTRLQDGHAPLCAVLNGMITTCDRVAPHID